MRSSVAAKFATITSLLAIAAPSAWAQTPTSLVVSFNAATGVPVGAWGVAGAALFIGLLAAYVLRSRNATASRLMALVGAIAATATLSISTQQVDAVAVLPTTNLIVSPATVSSVSGGNYTFINAAGGPATITNVALVNAPINLAISAPGTTCVPGLTLAVGQTCVVSVLGTRG